MPQWMRTDEYKNAHLPLASAADSKSLPLTVVTTAQSSSVQFSTGLLISVQVPNGWLVSYGFEQNKPIKRPIKSPIGANIELQDMQAFDVSIVCKRVMIIQS